MNTWFLCLQQTGNNRYASVTSDPSLLDDVVIDLEFQHHANDWTWFDTERLHSLIVQDAERNPDGCMVEDWETGCCEVVDGILVAIPDFPEDDEPEIEPEPAGDCHPAYEPCLPNLPGDALNCGDLTSGQKPVRVKEIGVDPYRLDRDGDGQGCTS